MPRPHLVVADNDEVYTVFMVEDIKKGTGLLVLVAEDNPVNQLLVVRLIERAGHQAIVVSNGEEAISLLERRGHFSEQPIEGPPIDIVLMDIQMPLMGGVEATRIIRQREKKGTAKIPIVGVTAIGVDEEKGEYLRVGMDDYLSKPIDTTCLQEILRGVFGAKWGALNLFS